MKPESKLIGKSDRDLLLISGKATHQHYKGGLYRYLGVPRDAGVFTDEGKIFQEGYDHILVYEHLYPHKQELWVRRQPDFSGHVAQKKVLLTWREEGVSEVDILEAYRQWNFDLGLQVSRFRELGKGQGT